MIARPLPAPRPRPASGGPRTARNASAARRTRVRRLRYRPIGRVVSVLCLATALVLVYLSLLANITRLTYEVGHQKQQRSRLLVASLERDDEIARLESRDNLEPLALKLGMRDPQAFAIVSLPTRQRRPSSAAAGVALLSGVSGWFR